MPEDAGPVGTAARRPAAYRATRERVDAARVLLWIYAVFVIAAGSRGIVQLALHASRAPLSYALSTGAAAGYAVGFVLVRGAARAGSCRAAVAWAAGELAAVLTVGTLSVTHAAAFPDATVWSHYGAGYLGLPMLLPIAVLIWSYAATHRPRTGTGAPDYARSSNESSPGRHTIHAPSSNPDSLAISGPSRSSRDG
jgi:hypothetical protein